MKGRLLVGLTAVGLGIFAVPPGPAQDEGEPQAETLGQEVDPRQELPGRELERARLEQELVEAERTVIFLGELRLRQEREGDA